MWANPRRPKWANSLLAFQKPRRSMISATLETKNRSWVWLPTEGSNCGYRGLEIECRTSWKATEQDDDDDWWRTCSSCCCRSRRCARQSLTNAVESVSTHSGGWICQTKGPDPDTDPDRLKLSYWSIERESEHAFDFSRGACVPVAGLSLWRPYFLRNRNLSFVVCVIQMLCVSVEITSLTENRDVSFIILWFSISRLLIRC